MASRPVSFESAWDQYDQDSWKDSVKSRMSDKTFTLTEIISIIESLPEIEQEKLSWDEFKLVKRITIDKEELIKKLKK